MGTFDPIIQKRRMSVRILIITISVLTAMLFPAISAVTAEPGESPGDPVLEPGRIAPHAVQKPDIPSLSSGLFELERAWSQSQSSGRQFAAQRGFDLSGDQVKVTFTLQSVEAVPPLLARINARGGSVDAQYKRWIDAWIPIASVRSLATFPGVTFLAQPTPVFPLGEDASPAKIPMYAGSYLTQGVAASNADDWHIDGYTGEGVNVAILDSFADYGTAQSLGELPGSITAHGSLDTGSRHGTAVAEIIHDMAPDAALTFASPGSSTQMASYISDLAAAGNQVISSSMGFYNDEPGDGNGPVSNAINNAYTTYSTLYAQAAGNQANYHWDGPYVDTLADDWHEWPGPDEVNYLGSFSSGTLYIFLRWDDWPASDQDYDLYIVEYNSGTGLWDVVASSFNEQSGTQPPTEEIEYHIISPGDYGIAINLWDADGTSTLDLMGHNAPSFQHNVSDRSLVDPATATYSFSVAAVDRSTYNRESYSSIGPTHGPGGALTGGIDKPRISGYANVDTWSYGYNAFNGTSAATPHVAGAAALVFDAYPWYGAGEVMGFLEDRAIDRGPTGYDLEYGMGRLHLGDPVDVDHIYLPLVLKE